MPLYATVEAILAHDLCEDEARCRECKMGGKCRSWNAYKAEAYEAERRERKRQSASRESGWRLIGT